MADGVLKRMTELCDAGQLIEIRDDGKGGALITQRHVTHHTGLTPGQAAALVAQLLDRMLDATPSHTVGLMRTLELDEIPGRVLCLLGRLPDSAARRAAVDAVQRLEGLGAA